MFSTRERFAVTGLVWIIVVATLGLPTPIHAEAVIAFDAAELDRNGDEIRNDEGYLMPCFRVVADNTTGETALTMPEFQLNYSASFNTWSGFLWDDPDNPWYGAREDDPNFFMLDGEMYGLATVWTSVPYEHWTFCYIVDPTPDDLNDYENDYYIEEVPIGVCLDATIFLSSRYHDVYLFQSPATGAFTASGETTDVIDYDRTPQTVPEPFTVVLVAGGALLIARRRFCPITA